MTYFFVAILFIFGLLNVFYTVIVEDYDAIASCIFLFQAALFFLAAAITLWQRREIDFLSKLTRVDVKRSG
jgi:hypothetical protein